MSKTVYEINNLNKAVNDFSEEMKARLAEQAARGKRDWDNMPIAELQSLMAKKIDEGKMRDEQWLLDVANYAMFLHKAVNDGREMFPEKNIKLK